MVSFEVPFAYSSQPIVRLSNNKDLRTLQVLSCSAPPLLEHGPNQLTVTDLNNKCVLYRVHQSEAKCEPISDYLRDGNGISFSPLLGDESDSADSDRDISAPAPGHHEPHCGVNISHDDFVDSEDLKVSVLGVSARFPLYTNKFKFLQEPSSNVNRTEAEVVTNNVDVVTSIEVESDGNEVKNECFLKQQPNCPPKSLSENSPVSVRGMPLIHHSHNHKSQPHKKMYNCLLEETCSQDSDSLFEEHDSFNILKNVDNHQQSGPKLTVKGHMDNVWQDRVNPEKSVDIISKPMEKEGYTENLREIESETKFQSADMCLYVSNHPTESTSSLGDDDDIIDSEVIKPITSGSGGASDHEVIQLYLKNEIKSQGSVVLADVAEYYSISYQEPCLKGHTKHECSEKLFIQNASKINTISNFGNKEQDPDILLENTFNNEPFTKYTNLQVSLLQKINNEPKIIDTLKTTDSGETSVSLPYEQQFHKNKVCKMEDKTQEFHENHTPVDVNRDVLCQETNIDYKIESTVLAASPNTINSILKPEDLIFDIERKPSNIEAIPETSLVQEKTNQKNERSSLKVETIDKKLTFSPLFTQVYSNQEDLLNTSYCNDEKSNDPPPSKFVKFSPLISSHEKFTSRTSKEEKYDLVNGMQLQSTSAYNHTKFKLDNEVMIQNSHGKNDTNYNHNNNLQPNELNSDHNIKEEKEDQEYLNSLITTPSDDNYTYSPDESPALAVFSPLVKNECEMDKHAVGNRLDMDLMQGKPMKIAPIYEKNNFLEKFKCQRVPENSSFVNKVQNNNSSPEKEIEDTNCENVIGKVTHDIGHQNHQNVFHNEGFPNDRFNCHDSNYSPVIEQVVPETFIDKECEGCDDKSSFYDVKTVKHKDKKLISVGLHHSSFQWKTVYGSVMNNNKNGTFQCTSADHLESITPLPYPLKRPRPLRVGLSKRQKVRHLHEK